MRFGFGGLSTNLYSEYNEEFQEVPIMSLIQHYECEILVTCGHHKAAIFELFLTGGLCKSNCPQNYYGDDPTEMLGEGLTYHMVENLRLR